MSSIRERGAATLGLAAAVFADWVLKTPAPMLVAAAAAGVAAVVLLAM